MKHRIIILGPSGRNSKINEVRSFPIDIEGELTFSPTCKIYVRDRTDTCDAGIIFISKLDDTPMAIIHILGADEPLYKETIEQFIDKFQEYNVVDSVNYGE